MQIVVEYVKSSAGNVCKNKLLLTISSVAKRVEMMAYLQNILHGDRHMIIINPFYARMSSHRRCGSWVFNMT